MGPENCAAPRGGDPIVGALLPQDATHGIGVIRSGRSVGYELGGVGRYDGGERNQENRSHDDNRNPCHSETYPKSTSPHERTSAGALRAAPGMASWQRDAAHALLLLGGSHQVARAQCYRPIWNLGGGDVAIRDLERAQHARLLAWDT